jgi:hypothetical protein
VKKLLCLLPFLAVGCTTATYTPDKGLSYKNFVFQKQFSELKISTDGTVSIKGYQSEAATLVRSVAEGVTTGMKGGVIP